MNCTYAKRITTKDTRKDVLPEHMGGSTHRNVRFIQVLQRQKLTGTSTDRTKRVELGVCVFCVDRGWRVGRFSGSDSLDGIKIEGKQCESVHNKAGAKGQNIILQSSKGALL